MRRYAAIELEAFLRAVDAELRRDCDIVLIGGGAIALAYRGDHATRDLDLWTTTDAGFWEAAERAAKKTETPVPLQKAAIAEPPYNFEERLILLPLDRMKHLTVFVPEPHDLALMKTARGEAQDLDAIEDIHREHPLDLQTLLERYAETKDVVTGPPARFRQSFLAMVARLFGEATADSVEQQV